MAKAPPATLAGKASSREIVPGGSRESACENKRILPVAKVAPAFQRGADLLFQVIGGHYEKSISCFVFQITYIIYLPRQPFYLQGA